MNGYIYGYARVSTRSQELNRQLDLLNEQNCNEILTGINYAVRFFCRIEREKTKPMAFSVANMQNMGLLIPISMCGHKQDSVFFIRRHDKETYGYSIF